jgi:arsenite oxidase large subunit
LLWLIGTNASGQVGNAEAKWIAVNERRGGRLPESSDKTEVVSVLAERMRAGGLAVVQQDIYPNPTTNHADLILPAAGWGEEDFTRYNGERRLKLFSRFQDAPQYRSSEQSPLETRCLPDWRIFQSVALHLLPAGHRVDAIRTGYAMVVPVTREQHFAWYTSSDVFEDMALHSDQADKNGLRLLVENIPAGQLKGHAWLRTRGTQGFVLPLKPGDSPGTVRESQRVPVTAGTPYAFVNSDWNAIKDDFERNRAREGEFFICNGRVNELWNSMFTNIRNETVRQRYPDDLPGTILEIGEEDAAKLDVRNGDVLAVECRDIHLGGSGSLLGVASVQKDFVPPGMVFAIFSYPALSARLEQFPFRSFTHVAYVNNITTGYVDPINPIAAVKFARGKIRKTNDRYSSTRFLGPSYAQRNRTFQEPPVRSEDERLKWKMRELVVQKGVPRARLHAEIDIAIADVIMDPDLFMETLERDAVFREGFKTVLGAGLMKWSGADGQIYDSWSQKELDVALRWLAQIEAKRSEASGSR